MSDAEKQNETPSDNSQADSLGLGRFGTALVDKFPHWFIVLLGLVYGTGFLIVFSFDNYFGVRGAVVEGLKAKYVHVGILCLQFPMSIGIIFLATLSMMRKPNAAENKTEITRVAKRKMSEAWAMSVFCIVMLFFFYLLTTFARPGHFALHERGIALFFLTTVVGALFMAWQRGLFWTGARFKKELLDP